MNDELTSFIHMCIISEYELWWHPRLAFAELSGPNRSLFRSCSADPTGLFV